jgi:hypothetical protein
MAERVKEMGMPYVQSAASPEVRGTTAVEFQTLVAAIEASDIVVPDLAATALGTILAGVITGEGPTAEGRQHFSRSLDDVDAAWCERILVAAGGRKGAPVTRLEADRLIEIDAAASERSDDGRFDDLMVKAVTHHVMAAAGRSVPPRDVALSSQVPVASWASRFAPADIDAEVLRWIASHVKGKRRLTGPLMTILGLLIGASPLTASLVGLVDLLA